MFPFVLIPNIITSLLHISILGQWNTQNNYAREYTVEQGKINVHQL